MNECITDGCTLPKRYRDRCSKHYQYFMVHENPDAPRCKVNDCDKPRNPKKDWCILHARRAARNNGNPLGVGKGTPGRARKILGKGSYINNGGYKIIVVLNDEGSKHIHVLEHRYIMEKYLGRKLLPGENVHHKDGNRLNNSLDNLELWVEYQPSGQRPEDLVVWAEEILRRYKDGS